MADLFPVDLRSDTVTRPTPAMRRAMAEAEVGDDVIGDDPTVIRLEELAARAMGKEAALFVPSGTMGNVLAVMAQAESGSEILVGELGQLINRCGGMIHTVRVDEPSLEDVFVAMTGETAPEEQHAEPALV